jgi:hypothetical protein
VPLLDLVLEVADAFLGLQDRCCMCGAPLTPVVKPSLCSKRLCLCQYSDLGVGRPVMAEIRRNPVAADLLLSVFSTRSQLGGCCKSCLRWRHLFPNVGLMPIFRRWGVTRLSAF